MGGGRIGERLTIHEAALSRFLQHTQLYININRMQKRDINERHPVMYLLNKVNYIYTSILTWSLQSKPLSLWCHQCMPSEDQ